MTGNKNLAKFPIKISPKQKMKTSTTKPQEIFLSHGKMNHLLLKQLLRVRVLTNTTMNVVRHPFPSNTLSTTSKVV